MTKEQKILKEAVGLLSAAKGLQFLAVASCPNYINKDSWETAFDNLEQAISEAKIIKKSVA